MSKNTYICKNFIFIHKHIQYEQIFRVSIYGS